jgi:hypothetical protein
MLRLPSTTIAGSSGFRFFSWKYEVWQFFFFEWSRRREAQASPNNQESQKARLFNFFNHFAKIYYSFKILQFSQPFAVTYGGRHVPRRFGSAIARGPPQVWRSAVVSYGGWPLTVVRHDGKDNRRRPRRQGPRSRRSVRRQACCPLYKPNVSPEMS